MLSRLFIRNNSEAIEQMLHDRNVAGQVDINLFLQLDEERRSILGTLENLKHQRNRTSQEIAQIKRRKEDPTELIAGMKGMGAEIKRMDERLKEVDAALLDVELKIPNVFHESVPVGGDERFNRIERTWGEIPDFPFQPRPHWEIGEDLEILDFQRASRITGARFVVYRGLGARLERALINFFLDCHAQAGYTEILPPFMVNEGACTGTGQLPKFKEDLFKLEGWDYYMVPTGEVPMTNLHREEILTEDQLPIKYCGYTPCFRSEAGSYGKDTRGLIRQHQFNKVELVMLTTPEESYDALETITRDAATILEKLQLPYRVVSLCSGDLGFSSAKTYDLEVWLPSQETYREISSCSNCEDFQARRAGIRFKREGSKKNDYVHTLNGSGLAVGRTVVAILENFQQADGSVVIPDILVPYMGGVEAIEPPA